MPTQRSTTKKPRKKSGPPRKKEAAASSLPCVVVGIGASAGGLEAIRELLENLPADTGFAFVLVQHLDPNHESRFADILSRHTRMPVREVKGDTPVVANRLYLLPPTSGMVLVEQTLRLTPREERNGRPVAIDRFFSSLAKACKGRAIGVVLSGTGTDGARGLIDIKGSGGITFAQDKTAKHEGMPQAAIASGCVDFEMSPEDIAGELTFLANSPQLILREQRAPVPKAEGKGDVRSILQLLHETTGVDFSAYKQGTIGRRIARRMLLLKLEKYAQYAEHLHQDPVERAALHQDLLIKVTTFFRDPEIFDALKKEVFAVAVRERPRDQPIRVWVPGCATGEEVYSLAIALTEYLEENRLTYSVQVFGTDLSEACVETARHGEFLESSLPNVSPERLRRFFARSSAGYQISKSIRERCVFAKHDLTQDPPFSGLDLVSCRNLLIYFEAALQKRVLGLFHYALKADRFLLLGNSENIGQFGELFATVDPRHKIFVKRPTARPAHFSFSRSRIGEVASSSAPKKELPVPPMDLGREADRVIANRFGPHGVVINDQLEVVQIRGKVGAFLEPASGEASHDLLKMTRMGLLTELRSAVHTAKKEQSPVRRENIRLAGSGPAVHVTFEVIPLHIATRPTESYYVILFAQTRPQKAQSGSKTRLREKPRVQELERELASMHEYLQSLIERGQSSTEELKSANEEILSSNEEMQSTNEELETAKEELQSTNEELSTLNDELQDRNHQLSVAVNDLHNLLTSVRIPVLMLSRDLRIRRITPGAEKVMNVIPSDVGRPITDMKLNFPDLIPLLREVIDKVAPQERQVQDSKGNWFSLWARPYLTGDNKIDGAVIALIDINAVKRASDYANVIVRTIREPLLVLDADLRIRTVNQSFYDTFRVSPSDTLGRVIYTLGDGQWDIPQLRSLLEEVLPKKSQFNDFEVRHTFPTLGTRVMLLNARRVTPGNDEPDLILLAIEDITRRKEAEEKLKKTANQLTSMNAELEQFAFVASHDLQEPLRMVSTYLELVAKTQRGKLDKEGEEYIDIAVGGARRMKALVQDLLAFSQTGRQDVQQAAVDCTALLVQVLKDVRPFLEENSATVTNDALPTVFASSRLLAEVFQNLVVNGVKFHGPRKPAVHVSAKRRDSMWEFSVRDNGIGIEAQYAEKIFLIFQRLHGSERAGTGIGLATCRKIVERFGGRMWLESVVGKGSTFFFTVPMVQAAERRGDSL